MNGITMIPTSRSAIAKENLYTLHLVYKIWQKLIKMSLKAEPFRVLWLSTYILIYKNRTHKCCDKTSHVKVLL